MSDKTVLEMVREFHTKFQASDDPALWMKLCQEEMAEVKEAIAHLLKELADLSYVAAGLELTAGSSQRGMQLFSEALGKNDDNALVAVIFDAIPEEVLHEAVTRVHASNLSKLGEDGKPLRREDGKVLKGPNYKPPVLDDLVV